MDWSLVVELPSPLQQNERWQRKYRSQSVQLLLKNFIQPTRKTYKSAVGDEYILSIRKTIQSGMLIPPISKRQETLLGVTDRGIIWYSIMRERQCATMFFYAGHRSYIIDRRSGNRCWDSELRSLINEDDWVITLISSIWWAKLNTHSNISGLNNLSARNRRVSGNEWPGITCARYHCRCRSRWLPRV